MSERTMGFNYTPNDEPTPKFKCKHNKRSDRYNWSTAKYKCSLCGEWIRTGW